MGKVKPDNCSPIITEDPYQFPMGKVKTRVLLQLTMELNKYQFPMGKVKSLTQLNNKYLDLYQFPMGKVK